MMLLNEIKIYTYNILYVDNPFMYLKLKIYFIFQSKQFAGNFQITILYKVYSVGVIYSLSDYILVDSIKTHFMSLC